MMPKVSIIVPMYNSEKYIKKCINSILCQTYTDFELIVIDDGSTDSSGKISDELSKSDSRIKVYHQSNHGLIYSRKQGLINSQGEFVLFIDSDDYIETGMLQRLTDLAVTNDADASMSGAFFVFEDYTKTVSNRLSDGVYAGDKLQEVKTALVHPDRYYSPALLPFLWCKLWKKELLAKHLLEVDESITIGEDVAIGLPALMEAQCIVVDNTPYYYYVQNSSSMMKSKRNEQKELKNAVSLFKYLSNALNFDEDDRNDKEGIVRLFVHQVLTRAYGLMSDKLNVDGIFPFLDKMPESVILYGAGDFGKAVYDHLNERTSIKYWLDSDHINLKKRGFDVSDPDEARFKDDDIVLVTVLDAKASGSISKYLTGKGVPEKNIYLFDISEEQEKMIADLAEEME